MSNSEVASLIATHRLHRATILVQLLEKRGFTLDMVRRMSPHGWDIVALTAKIKRPSEDTRKLAMELMEARKGNHA